MVRHLPVYADDNLISLMERLSFHLMEMGIKVDVVEASDEAVIYRMGPAEHLPDKGAE